MQFKTNTYNQHLCVTIAESGFLDDFKEYMQWQYFQQFLVSSDENLMELKRKTDVINDVCQIIEDEAYSARATG